MSYARVTLFGSMIGGALLLAGCNSKTSATPENFIAALNTRYVDHPECLMPNGPRFPFETTDPEKTRQLDALAAAQLLTVKKEAAIHVSRYTVTPVGSVAAPRFCYGHKNVTAIDSFTPPVQANGFPETQVSFQYSMMNVPVWAKTPEVLAAFPEMAQAIGGTSHGKATLAKTMAGWSVPD